MAMQLGTDLEPVARAAYEAQTGSVMRPLVLVDGAYSASLDGMTLLGDLILEIKCPLCGTRSDLRQDVQTRTVPEHYLVQVPHQLILAVHPKEFGAGVSVTRFCKAGNVDYKRVPSLHGVNLDDYRGKAREEVRVSVC